MRNDCRFVLCFLIACVGLVGCGDDPDSSSSAADDLANSNLLTPTGDGMAAGEFVDPSTTASGVPIDMGSNQNDENMMASTEAPAETAVTPSNAPAETGTTMPAMGAVAAPDGNDSFQEAVEILDGPAMGVIGAPGDRDFYRFPGQAGQWIVVTIEANAEDDLTKVDTVIRLYNEQMLLIAENDDAIPRLSTDSEMITRLPSDGAYYIEVLEFSDWMPTAGMPAEGNSTYTYSLTVGNLNPQAEVVTVDAEGGNDLASAQVMNISGGFGLVAGMFENATDVDVFRISVTAETAQRILVLLMPAGSTGGYGSTTSIGRAWLTTADGTTVIARTDGSSKSSTLHPTVTAGDYMLWLEHPGGTLGANDFYAVKVYSNDDGASEAAEASNGTIAGAEPVSLTQGMRRRSASMLANVAVSDVDFFSVSTLAGENFSVSCSGLNVGSGVIGLNVQIQDAAGTVLAEGTESATESANARIENQPAADYFVRVSIASQSEDLAADFVRCVFFAFSN